MRDAAANIAPYISHIINMSVESGVFSTDLKRAKVVPLFPHSVLQTAQNKLMRVILKVGHRSHIGRSQFEELNWLPVESRIIMTRMNMIHKILFGSGQMFLSCLITKVKDKNNICTRGSISDLRPYSF